MKELPYYSKGIRAFSACSTEEELRTNLTQIIRKEHSAR